MDFRNPTVPKIPRANANSKGWEPTNLELAESGSTRALFTPDRQGNGMVNSSASTTCAHVEMAKSLKQHTLCYSLKPNLTILIIGLFNSLHSNRIFEIFQIK